MLCFQLECTRLVWTPSTTITPVAAATDPPSPGVHTMVPPGHPTVQVPDVPYQQAGRGDRVDGAPARGLLRLRGPAEAPPGIRRRQVSPPVLLSLGWSIWSLLVFLWLS